MLREVTAYQDYLRKAGEALDGKHYVLDGVSGTIKYREFQGRGVHGLNQRISHVADEEGKKTEYYCKTARELGDDYDTDLTDSERLVDILCELGLESEAEA